MFLTQNRGKAKQRITSWAHQYFFAQAFCFWDLIWSHILFGASLVSHLPPSLQIDFGIWSGRKEKAAIYDALFLRITSSSLSRKVKRKNKCTQISSGLNRSRQPRWLERHPVASVVGTGDFIGNVRRRRCRGRRRRRRLRAWEWGSDDERPEAEAKVDGRSSRPLCGCRHQARWTRE